MSRLFDPVALMSSPLGENATRRTPLPVGETTAQIAEIDFSSGISAKNQQPWTRMDVKLEITDPAYLAQYPGAAEKLTTTLGIMLDLQNGQIATGDNRNIRLGRLRAATDTNGQPLDRMVGKYLRIQIGHKAHPTEPDVVLDEITGFTKV